MHFADGDAWKDKKKTHKSFFQDARNVLIGMCADGVSPFEMSKRNYSMLCIVFNLYNLPASLRSDFENMFIWGICEGKCKTRLVFKVLCEDLKELWRGAGCFDFYEEESFVCRAMLCNMLHDYPGFTSTACQSAHGALSGCVRCSIEGTHVAALSKVVYARSLQTDQEHPTEPLKDKEYLIRTAWEVEVLHYLENQSELNAVCCFATLCTPLCILCTPCIHPSYTL